MNPIIETLPFRVDSIELESDSVKSFYLFSEQGDTKEYLPGQFVTLRLADGPGNSLRSYSLSDAYDRHYYRISVKRETQAVKGGFGHKSVSNFLHDFVLPGSRVFLSPPTGSFIIDPRNNDPITMIAGGIGITPFISAIETAVASRLKRDMYLVYCIKNEHEFPFGQRLSEIAAEFPHIKPAFYFTQQFGGRSEPASLLRHGRPDLDHIAQQLRSVTASFYLCGPSPMIAAAKHSLLNAGIEPERIRQEFFGLDKSTETDTNLLLSQSGEAVVYPVTFADSGKTVGWRPADGSLLDLASASDVEISAGCRYGDCGTCLTRLVAGRVRYRHTTGITPDSGYCLPCSCEPETAITLGA